MAINRESMAVFADHIGADFRAIFHRNLSALGETDALTRSHRIRALHRFSSPSQIGRIAYQYNNRNKSAYWFAVLGGGLPSGDPQLPGFPSVFGSASAAGAC
jgi:hypothetical protein